MTHRPEKKTDGEDGGPRPRARLVHIREEDLDALREAAERCRRLEGEAERLAGEAAGLKDRCARTAAEFDNYRKRVEREKDEIRRFGSEEFVRKVLPFDEIFGKALAQVPAGPSAGPVAEGLAMLRREFSALLASLGVKRIEALGRPFDPHLHEASGVVETDEAPEGTVVAEDRPGYLLNERVLRPALVRVARGRRPAEENDDGSQSREGESVS